MDTMSIDGLKEFASFDFNDWREGQERESVLWTILTDEFRSEVAARYHLQTLLDADVFHIGTNHRFKDGGNISTIHNAKNGVFVDEEHQQRFEKEYSRKDYEGSGKRTLSEQRKKMFQEQVEIRDEYTGKILSKDKSTHIDHITSAKHIHDNDAARLYMTDDQRNDMATSPDNMAPINGSLNQSKGEQKLDDWLQKTKNGQTNEERFGVDKGKALKKQKKSEKEINKTVFGAHMKEIAEGAGAQGFVEAKRQAVGVIILEFQELFVEDFQVYMRRFGQYKTLDDKVEHFKQLLKRGGEKLKYRLSHIKEFLLKIFGNFTQGMASGVIGALITALINSFITTFKNVAKLIQTGVSSLIEGIKVLIYNPENLSTEDKIKSFIKISLSGISVALGIMLEEGVKNGLEAAGVPATIAGFVGAGVGLLSTTMLTGITVYFVDHFDEAMQEMQAVANTIMFGLEHSAKSIKKAYDVAITKVDELYQQILADTVDYYAEMNALSDLAFDFSLPSVDQFKNSIDYAEASGVDNNRILNNKQDIVNFFNS